MTSAHLRPVEHLWNVVKREVLLNLKANICKISEESVLQEISTILKVKLDQGTWPLSLYGQWYANASISLVVVQKQNNQTRLEGAGPLSYL